MKAYLLGYSDRRATAPSPRSLRRGARRILPWIVGVCLLLAARRLLCSWTVPVGGKRPDSSSGYTRRESPEFHVDAAHERSDAHLVRHRSRRPARGRAALAA